MILDRVPPLPCISGKIMISSSQLKTTNRYRSAMCIYAPNSEKAEISFTAISLRRFFGLLSVQLFKMVA